MKLLISTLVCLSLVFLAVNAKVYFSEDFDEGWESRWVVSKAKEAENAVGKWANTAGKYFNDESKDKGIQTSEDNRFYQLTAKFEPFSNKDKDLVLQYRVKNEQDLDCGGGYIKLIPPGLDQTQFNGDSKYNIMFGPDVCGSTKRVHAILNYKDNNYLVKRNVYPETDKLSHIYTFVLKPDQSYEIWVDGQVKQDGTIEGDWDILPPKQIKDPSVSKPEDWVDEAQIPDPDAKKPEGWDDIPKEIPDPDAQKPEDWDEELDGEWEPPLISNPEYKGEWKAPLIDNPAYKGEWEHPLIDNPDYFEDPNIYAYTHEYIGFELWQVKSGSLFDNILVTDDVAEAKAFIDGYFAELKEGEKKSFDDLEAKRKEEEAAALAGDEDTDGDADEEGEDDEEEDDEEADDNQADDHAGHEHEDL